MTAPSMSGTRNPYREQHIQSATPNQIVVMLYDGLLTNIAKIRMAATNSAGTDRVKLSEGLTKAMAILLELRGALNVEVGGELAQNLANLYVFWITALSPMDEQYDEEKLTRVEKMVREMRDAFEAARLQLMGADRTAALQA